MTLLSQKILENFQIRKSKKQKLAFINLMQKYLPALQLQKGGFPKCRNLILGDVANAKVILTAHYDTCSRLPFPNFITPKKPLYTILYNFLVIIPLFCAVFFLNTLLNTFSDYLWLNYFLSVGVYFAFLVLLIAGPANKNTANDNTSGVITLCELIDTLTEEERKKVAFVFFDHEETGLLGSSYFKKKYKAIIEDKLLINFDCVSDGDYFLLSTSEPAKDKYESQILGSFQSNKAKTVMFENSRQIYYPSDHAIFPVSLAVAALKYTPVIGYYMDKIHTNKDTAFDETNITFLCNCIHSLVQKL